MKAIAIVLLAAILGFTVYVSRAADEGSRPPGILARDWVRVTERLGFVITQTDGGGRAGMGGVGDQGVLLAAPEMVGADLMPPLKGYFVIQTPTGWRQIAMAEPAPTR
jgi:hypothetical protein